VNTAGIKEVMVVMETPVIPVTSEVYPVFCCSEHENMF
jgi:hypothetical protein